MPELSLEGKVALVTGAGRGIGAGIARLLAARGAHVWVNDISDELAKEIVQAIREQAQSAECAIADVSDPPSVRRMVEACLAQKQRLDILVNNAGIGGTGKLLTELSYEEWNRMLGVNLSSAFLLCHAVLPVMMRNNWGRIINISSIFGLAGAAGSTHYAAAKAGIIGLSKSLAREVASSRITVNVVAPGIIDTPMFRARGVKPEPPWLLWPRIGQPEDVAQVVAFLSSEEAEFLTGQVISPNGGGWM